MSEIQVLGVIGAGVMGSGIAYLAASHGLQVKVVDISEEQLKKCLEAVRRDIKSAMLLGEKRLDGPEVILARIQTSIDHGILASADYIVESIVERWEEKQRLYRKLGETCSRDCMIAANTSAIPITRIASAFRDPGQIIGIHFMNPVAKKTHVEVIAGRLTARSTIERTIGLLRRFNKNAIMVKDSPGFVSNRVLMLMVNEAVNLVREQVANPVDVDAVFKNCFGHKMGPLETADLIGLDTILLSLEVLFENYRDPKYCPSPLLREMVDAGEVGRKSGRGFFQYQP